MTLSARSYLYSQNGTVYFPFNLLLTVRKFTDLVFRGDNSHAIWDDTLLTYSDRVEFLENSEHSDWFVKPPKITYRLSRSLLVIIADDEPFRYIYFMPKQLAGNKLLSLYDKISVVFGRLGELAGVTKNIELPWEKLDDEKFENLCYDIIYHSQRYDNDTIRKMGKSRSRDGGRDIVVYTRQRPGVPKKMYIFQCKFTRTGSSMTTQKVENISDTVLHYHAQGYGVMTPVVIDAALYDRIDGICVRLKIESDNWSGLEIERFLARHPNLRERYFKP